MLTRMDDTLWHQLPTTFDHVGTSDPRFFDRYWFACYDPRGGAALQLTMGAYRNMNVFDGGAALVVNGKQHNVRVSRALNRDSDSHCGPLRVDSVIPLEELRLTVGERWDDRDTPFAADITWRGIEPAVEEEPHFERLRGRVAQEYVRFCQVGSADGWIRIGDRTIDVSDWWACRDHSWGVRRGMAMREPITGEKASLQEKGHVQAFLYFSTDVYSGRIHMLRRGDEPAYTSGSVVDRKSGAELIVTAVDMNLDLFEGTRRFRAATFIVGLEDGTKLTIENTALGSSFAMRGLGYSGGYDDRKGPGVWRGDAHLESETWGVSSPNLVDLGGGESEDPWHRIQPVSVQTHAGQGASSSGTGSMTLIVSGRLPAYLTTS